MGKKIPKRRAWRKAKIEDVEEALEDERLVNKMKHQQAQSGQAGSSKKKGKKDKTEEEELSELFTVDTEGSFEGVTKASRREIARNKLFPPKGPNLGLSASEEGKIARAEGRLARPSSASSKAKEPEVFDLWGSAPVDKNGKSAHEAAMTVKRRPQPVAQSVPKTLHQRVGAAPAVLPAHEGQSVNPDSSAYEDLACMAAARELEREREAEALDRRLHPISAALRDAHGAEALKGLDEETKIRMYRELTCSTATADAEGSAGEASGSASRGKRKEEKSEAQRSRERKRKDLDARQTQLRARKRLEKSVGDVGAILKEMDQKEAWQKERRGYREKLKASREELEKVNGTIPKRRRLGRSLFTEDALVVPEQNAGEKGLRSMPLKASAVRERLSSIVRRGMLPAMPEGTRGEAMRRKKKNNKLRNTKKYISPLLQDNLGMR
mmetsp:Transcript_103678/g.231588  ORF Transcript_103678/g.231588 Transcript_103678/m.231588 type:complete len:439 (+) Transcript_103678:84-1400(+)